MLATVATVALTKRFTFRPRSRPEPRAPSSANPVVDADTDRYLRHRGAYGQNPVEDDPDETAGLTGADPNLENPDRQAGARGYLEEALWG